MTWGTVRIFRRRVYYFTFFFCSVRFWSVCKSYPNIHFVSGFLCRISMAETKEKTHVASGHNKSRIGTSTLKGVFSLMGPVYPWSMFRVLDLRLMELLGRFPAFLTRETTYVTLFAFIYTKALLFERETITSCLLISSISQTLLCWYNWGSARQYLQFDLCDQRILRSASASTQSDQSLRWSHAPSTSSGLSRKG